MRLADGGRIDSPYAAMNPLRETILRLEDMKERGVGLCIECMEEEPIYAKGRCRACFEWRRRNRSRKS